MKRRRNTKAKGNTFEREICTKLSLWWTNGKNDDVFWRSTSSGARATTRSKRGKSTTGNHGDIQAVDPIGKPFIDVFTLEIKRGYPGAHVGELLDSQNGKVNATNEFYGFLQQAAESAKNAKSLYWLLIHKRDRRETMIYFPQSFLAEHGHINFKTFVGIKLPSLRQYGWLCGTRLSEFLSEVSPDEIKNIQKKSHRR